MTTTFRNRIWNSYPFTNFYGTYIYTLWYFYGSYLLSHTGRILELLCCSFLSLCQRTPLHTAAGEGYRYTVEHLVKNGADISIKDNKGVSF